MQSPQEAAYADMPESAIAHDGRIDLVADLDALAREICDLVGLESRLDIGG